MNDALNTRSDVTVVLFLFIFLAIIGVISGGFFVRDYARARASAAWPTTEGVVLSERDGASGQLRYAYSMDGHSYESTRTRVFSARFMKPQPFDYLPGERVTVYVDPRRHQFSVLQTGGAGAAFVFFSLVSGALVFFGVGGVVWVLSERGAHEWEVTNGVSTH